MITKLEDIIITLEGAGLKVKVVNMDKLPEFKPPYSEGLTYYLEDLAKM